MVWSYRTTQCLCGVSAHWPCAGIDPAAHSSPPRSWPVWTSTPTSSGSLRDWMNSQSTFHPPRLLPLRFPIPSDALSLPQCNAVARQQLYATLSSQQAPAQSKPSPHPAHSTRRLSRSRVGLPVVSPVEHLDPLVRSSPCQRWCCELCLETAFPLLRTCLTIYERQLSPHLRLFPPCLRSSPSRPSPISPYVQPRSNPCHPRQAAPCANIQHPYSPSRPSPPSHPLPPTESPSLVSHHEFLGDVCA